MYPILILRSELICLVILIFLFFMSRSYNIDSRNNIFSRILRLAIIHVIFDITTVLTVNHTDSVPRWFNWICHIIFYLSAILYSNELANYVVNICYPRKAKHLYAVGHALTLFYICCLPFLKVEYVADLGTYSSAGPAAIAGYGLAFVFFASALVLVLTHMKKMPGPVKSALIPMMLVLMVTEISQVIWRSVLFTGGAITIVTVGFFFSLENPVAVFKKKAMTDALTGVRSRSSYEEDVGRFDRQFQKSPCSDYIFVFIDLNDLRSVNNRLGHAEGDNYITLIAEAINRCMKQATSIYRIGGDEFLIMYYRSSESIVEKEIRDLQDYCAQASKKLPYTAQVSAGYAQSSTDCKSLRDVVRTADYSMYQNKIQIKSGKLSETSSLGTKLNYSGLTDKIFDVMCASSDRSYPFITNLDTNVTRIAPGWKEYFGLDSEFYSDFLGIWKERIHPDHLEGYMEDVIEVINGHRKYHNFDYLAKKASGEYVQVSCHGSVYRNFSDGASYFSGFMVNMGMNSHIDPLTGLENFDMLSSLICGHMDEGEPFSIIKLKINNIARINMLYGYDAGNEIITKLVDILREELDNRGEVFCQASVNFSILLETCDEQILERYYRRIAEICVAGVQIDKGLVPVLISGGAITNKGERRPIEQMRGALVFALEESLYYKRNTLVFYRELANSAVDTDISLLAMIHADALAGMKNFRLRYQPIVDAATKRTVGAEALLRWFHPIYGEVPPSKFIAFLENDPCYYRMGLGILDQAVKDSKKIQEVIPDFKINVNITALQLQNESFTDHVFEILKRYDYAPNALVLELTERCKEMDSGFLAGKIAEFREKGVLIAFDDMGTGYSTINLLMDIPVDEIKLDKDFVKEISSRENYQLFVKALVVGCSNPDNNYTICFEGVETEEILSNTSSYGNFLTQGYYFAKPLLIDDFIEYVRRGN